MKHIAFGMYDMGELLASEYGETYFAIGTQFYNSSFTAYRSWPPDGELQNFTLRNDTSDLINSFVEASMQTGVLLLSNQDEYERKMAAILTSPQTEHFIGLAFDVRSTYEVIPALAYDVIIFIRDSTPATPAR